MEARIDSAKPEDLPAILSLLREVRLPAADVERHLESALVARDGARPARLLGCAALECYGTAALLRSVAVLPSARGRGLGGQLTDAALALARRRGIRTLYLLTETAEPFFARFGFTVVPRSAVAPAVQASVEFTTACPASAVAMVREL